MSDLKPCPFCGKDPNQTTAELGDRPCFYYECENPKCHAAEMGWHDTEQEAINAWNTRPIEDALQARIAELEAEVANLNEWLTAWKESFNLAQAEIAKLKRRVANAIDSAMAAQNCIKIARVDIYKVLERIIYILTARPKEEE